MASSAPAPAPQPVGRRWFSSRYALGACLALLAAGALWMGLRPGAEANRPAHPFVVFVPGQRLVYHLEFAGASAADFSALFDAAPSALSQAFEAALEGELAVTVLEAGPERTLLVYHLRPAELQFRADGREAPDQAQVLRTDLALPVFGSLDARGRVLSVRFDPAAGPLSQHMTRALLATTQFVGPETGAGPRAEWEAEEDDPAGTFLAHYQAREDGTVRKAKVRHLQPKQTRKRRAIVLTPTIQSAGESVATFDAGCLVALSAEETQHVTIQNKQVGQGTLKLTLRLLRKEEATPAELAALRGAAAERARTAPAVPLSVARPPEEGRLAIQRQELGDATLADLLADLAQAEAAPPEEQNFTRLFLKFKALAIVQPQSCVRLGELLTRAAIGSLKMRLLTDALEAAGHAEAQAALSAAIQGRSRDWPALALLIPALGMAESPTPQTVQSLYTLAFGKHEQNVTVAAQLALGNLARTLAEESPARAAQIVQRLLQELAAPTTPDSTWQLLLALGNAGATEALPTLTRFLDDPAPDLRGAAAWALRWIDSPQADLLLTTKVLLGDRDPAVRLEAVRALRFREKTPANCAAQEKALATEGEGGVRLALLGNLWDARASYPRARRLVERAAAADPAAEVREAAARLLE